jgi:hypothetical protein
MFPIVLPVPINLALILPKKVVADIVVELNEFEYPLLLLLIKLPLI